MATDKIVDDLYYFKDILCVGESRLSGLVAQNLLSLLIFPVFFPLLQLSKCSVRFFILTSSFFNYFFILNLYRKQYYYYYYFFTMCTFIFSTCLVKSSRYCVLTLFICRGSNIFLRNYEGLFF